MYVCIYVNRRIPSDYIMQKDIKYVFSQESVCAYNISFKLQTVSINAQLKVPKTLIRDIACDKLDNRDKQRCRVVQWRTYLCVAFRGFTLILPKPVFSSQRPLLCVINLFCFVLFYAFAYPHRILKKC